MFKVNIGSGQYLLNAQGFSKLITWQVKHWDDWTATPKFSERFEHWNKIVELAVVVEPIAYHAVFHQTLCRSPDTETSLRRKLDDHRRRLRTYLTTLDLAEIHSIRGEFCLDAEVLDDNKLTHVLLRLMSQHERLRLKSALGGSMLFLSMAEIIRRAVEEGLDSQLPEEDEMGFGQWMDGARTTLYGTDRILDAPPQLRRDFLRTMGLDSGVKVRCYVEGDTEYGALASAVGDAGGVEFVNLRGQVIERSGKGLRFVGSLQTDRKSHVFSIVVIDADQPDPIRALTKAARDDAMFGRFFLSDPDFEFGNFTLEELVDVFLDRASKVMEEAPSREDVSAAVAGAGSGREFFSRLRKFHCEKIVKSEAWGVQLMNYAVRNREFPANDKRAGKVRPCIGIADLLINAQNVGYRRSVDNFRVDPVTGELRQR